MKAKGDSEQPKGRNFIFTILELCS